MLNIFINISNSEFPLNKGCFLSNSPKTQPKLHISIDSSYLLAPKNISGALYHFVTKCFVSTLFSFGKSLANPKSDNAHYPLEFINILDGFISLCIILFLCKYAIAYRRSYAMICISYLSN